MRKNKIREQSKEGKNNLRMPMVTDIESVLKHILAECGDDLAVVLIGSEARGARTENSDIDLLVVGREAPRLRSRFPSFHIQMVSSSEFLANLCKGEDFEAWCIRLGRALHDKGIWKSVLESKCANSWPNWRTKVLHGARRLQLAHALLDMGDLDAAREELVYALGHAGRGLLLKSGIFPLSRPEIAAQLHQIGYPSLARMHETLRGQQAASIPLLRQAEMYTKKILAILDRDAYKKWSDDSRIRKKEKQRRYGRS